jgi:hypothetical protein
MSPMEPLPTQAAPCPKCGGSRSVAMGSQLGLEYSRCQAICCTNCGYVEFYATRETLESVAKSRVLREALEAKQREKEMRRGR